MGKSEYFLAAQFSMQVLMNSVGSEWLVVIVALVSYDLLSADANIVRF